MKANYVLWWPRIVHALYQVLIKLTNTYITPYNGFYFQILHGQSGLVLSFSLLHIFLKREEKQ